MIRVFEFEERFDSRITVTFILCHSKNSPNSLNLLHITFALNCIMVKKFLWTACIGIEGGSCCGVCRVDVELQEQYAQSLIRRFSAPF